MRGKALPRRILGAAPAGETGEFVLTQSLIDFLRAELRTYKASVRTRGRNLTDRQLSGDIQHCPAVEPPVEFSEETLRRFLKNDRQKQGDQFLRAIGQFLLNEKWISQTDINAHEKEPYVRAALAFQSFLGAQPGAKTLEFYGEVAGMYSVYACQPGRIVSITLNVSVHEDPPILRVYEREDHFRSGAAEMILRETDGLHPKAQGKIEKLLASHAERVGAPRYSSGFGIADAKIVSFFLRADLKGDASVYLVDALSHDERDLVGQFAASRYVGWTMGEGLTHALTMHRVAS